MSASSSSRGKTSGAAYHALPVAPVLNPDVDGDLEDSVILGSEPEPYHHQEVELDAKILWILFVLGCAVLLPWNVIITAMPYFLSQLQGSSYQGSFGSYVTTSFTVVNFAVLAFATATSKQASQSRRITLSTLLIALLTLFLTITTFLSLSPTLFFFLTLSNGILQAVFGGYLQTSVMVIGALFGSRAMQAVMSGQAAVAVIVSGVQVVSSVASVWGEAPEVWRVELESVSDGKAESAAAFKFFGLSTVFMVATVGAYVWLKAMPAYKKAVEPMESRARLGRGSGGEDQEETEGLVGGMRGARKNDDKAQIIRVAKANVLAEAAVAWVFIVTLAVFPTITVTITPTNPDTHPLLFSAIHFFIFNVGDFVGRYSCSFPIFHIWSQRKLLLISLARTLFIPLFLMCNVSGGDPSKPALINSDLLFMLILLACGLTTGHVSTMCIVSASSSEHNKRLQGREDVDVAATVASFFLVGGLAVGSAASFLVRYWICGCNPFQS